MEWLRATAHTEFCRCYGDVDLANRSSADMTYQPNISKVMGFVGIRVEKQYGLDGPGGGAESVTVALQPS
ncbi:hypothetical protein SRHO_G00032100 [Serrasalmus rhombeus]